MGVTWGDCECGVARGDDRGRCSRLLSPSNIFEMVKRGDLGFVGMLCLWGMGYSFNTRNECAWNVTYNWEA